MSSPLSLLPPRVCQPLEEKELKGPPDPRQGFLGLNLLARSKLSLKSCRAKSE